MTEIFDNILDKCIDRIKRGDRLEDCLADYPEHAEELKRLLEPVFSTLDAFSYKPQAAVRQRARQRFNAALRESEKRQEKRVLPFPWILGRARSWAAIATIVAIAFGGYFGIMQLTSQETDPGIIIAETNSEGNFAFLISDEQNSFGDFQNLELTVSRIILLQENGDWVEFVPETSQVDLVQLQGDMSQQVWRGDVPNGQYSGAVLYITGVNGVLKNGDETADIGLNGDELHLDIDFEVANNQETEVTDFIYQITVQNTDSGHYNLQAMSGESGTNKR